MKLNRTEKKTINLTTYGVQLVMGIAGIIMILHPQNIYNLILNFTGIAMMVLGIVRGVIYFLTEPHVAVTEDHLTTGIMLAVVGLLLMVFKNAVIAIFPMLLGILLLYGGAMRLESTLDLKRLGGRPIALLISSIASIVLGILVLVNPFGSAMTLMRCIGIALVLEAVMDGVYTARLNKWLEALGYKPN